MVCFGYIIVNTLHTDDDDDDDDDDDGDDNNNKQEATVQLKNRVNNCSIART
jgi:hypothetical protein